MDAQFVSLVVGYALAGGRLRRKGVKRRPWLEWRRMETEATYLRHQFKALRQVGGPGVISVIDSVPGSGYYDLCRGRLHSPLLERAMEILCPEGEIHLSAEALQVAGDRGLASAWLDSGHWDGPMGRFEMRSRGDAEALHSAIQERGIRGMVLSSGGGRGRCNVFYGADAMQDLVRLLRPHVHRSMRHSLWPGVLHGSALLVANKEQAFR
jgi:hypothetical protein